VLLTPKSHVEKVFCGGYRLGVPKRADIPLNRAAFGRNFARLFTALEAKTSQRAFALDLGVGEDRVSKWLSGRLPVPDTTTLIKIAARFNVSVDVLLEGVNATYDKIVIARTQRAYENKYDDVPPIVIEPVVQDELPAGGGSHDAKGSLDRVSKSSSQSDAEMLREFHELFARHFGKVPPRSTRARRKKTGRHRRTADDHQAEPKDQRRSGGKG
jgi:transcriptional regulator with XRE-family HTH domain